MKIYRAIKSVWTDERGTITALLDDGKTLIASVLVITCKKGAIRANHYHKEDSHYSYMLSGKMEYTEKPAPGRKGKQERAIVKKGDMVFTPPLRWHRMRFLENSVFVALATKSRKDGAYENDTIRIAAR